MTEKALKGVLGKEAVDALVAGKSLLANVTSQETVSLRAEYEQAVEAYARELLAVLESPEINQRLLEEKNWHEEQLSGAITDRPKGALLFLVSKGFKIDSPKVCLAFHKYNEPNLDADAIVRYLEFLRFSNTPIHGDQNTVYIPLSPGDLVVHDDLLPHLVLGAKYLFDKVDADFASETNKKQHNLKLLGQANEILGGLK